MQRKSKLIGQGEKDGEEGGHSKNKETFQIIPDYKNAKSGPEREDGGSKVYACFKSCFIMSGEP